MADGMVRTPVAKMTICDVSTMKKKRMIEDELTLEEDHGGVPPWNGAEVDIALATLEDLKGVLCVFDFGGIVAADAVP